MVGTAYVLTDLQWATIVAALDDSRALYKLDLKKYSDEGEVIIQEIRDIEDTLEILLYGG